MYDLIKAEFDSFGAELKSVIDKKTGREYIWCGDPAVWGRTAPVLFPFVGACNGKKYTFEGKDYPMTSHGFARDKEHELVSKSDKEITFSLKDSGTTYEIYPFHFEFINTYRLEGSTVTVEWKVVNPGQDRDDQNLYFSLGAHPAFVCPINGEANKAGYRIFFRGQMRFIITVILQGHVPMKTAFLIWRITARLLRRNSSTGRLTS